jgi:hypothetical protein
LQPFRDLVGSWRATGEPKGTREEQQQGFWTEAIRWEWRFKGADAWLRAEVTKGKHWRDAELHYLPVGDRYRLTVQDSAGRNLVFTGKLTDRRLTLDSDNGPNSAGQRIVLSLLHANRYLFRFEERSAESTVYRTAYLIGATKEGIPFAADVGSDQECIVTGGVGTIAVAFQGKTYYVCCSGCRDAFKQDPVKFVREFEARKAKGK